MKTLLVLEDGRSFEGISLGAYGETCGEVVFNTSMTGYQEILTDPSYAGQLVAMTYPLIGNYGVNAEDVESGRVWAEGFIVREESRIASNWRSEGGLGKYLRENGIVGIQGIDTRALTRHIRERGSMRGVISSRDMDVKSLRQKAADTPEIVGRDLVSAVTCDKPYEWTEGFQGLPRERAGDELRRPPQSFQVVAYDFGIKRDILRKLVDSGCRVHVLPAFTPWEEALSYDPDGIFLSNGPGDPEGVPYAIDTLRQLIGKRPIFGICLGHQVLSLALGVKTYKLRFGHHGGNHPVRDLKTGRIEITSQNHCFAIRKSGIPDSLEITHINLNDNTVEGLRHRDLPIFSIQYHPEASPGPHDSSYLFHAFTALMDSA